MKIHTLLTSSTGPVILWGMYPHRNQELEKTVQAISDLAGIGRYTLIAFEVSDWNGSFSPWKTPLLEETFSGGAENTWNDLKEKVLPEIWEQYGRERKLYLMGYSLAGLFALWAMYQTDLFEGAASCSGSLWYPGFIDYMKERSPIKEKHIYISLGGKEANTHDKLMSTIADCTREAVVVFKAENTVKYEQNAGGHFADPGKRLAKAVQWITEESEAPSCGD